MEHNFQHLPRGSVVPTDPDYPTLRCERCGKWWYTFGPAGPDRCGIQYRTIHEVQFLEGQTWQTDRTYLKLKLVRQYKVEVAQSLNTWEWRIETLQIPINYQVATFDKVLQYHASIDKALAHAEQLVMSDEGIIKRKEVIRISERLTTSVYHVILTYHPAPKPLVQGYGVHCVDHRKRERSSLPVETEQAAM